MSNQLFTRAIKKILIVATFVIGALSGFAQCIPLVYDAQIHSVAAAPTMSLNLVSDFCAVGDGQTNDYDAFVRARNFIAYRGGYCSLYIPAGTYLINVHDLNNMNPGGGLWHLMLP